MKWHKLIPAALLTIILTTGLLTGCAKVEADQPSGLVVNSLSYSIGNVDGDPEKPVKISYSLSIQNKSKSDIFIGRVTPVISGPGNDLILTQTDDFDANTKLAPDSFANINGELILDPGYTGMTKEDMKCLMPKTTESKVSAFAIYGGTMGMHEAFNMEAPDRRSDGES
ncbi:MAG: hypothetical protein P3T54_05345 [Dehalogenimonas sp.]|uniref:DUF4352 domain-containing protein n=1 Tax=Candidatus Dehalogenimonas loeffleri TaxID=3127115 RepID=A0ABZ2J269_9CHLR|nr:hypothetical protein [Dehalogenimonas sp.]